MKNIVYPTNFFDRPFADTGNKQVIPETTATAGRASLTSGFPIETQQPLSNGGIAPSRLDFNGILNMLSAMAFWQQSGGQWAWSSTLNYTVPCVVYHADVLWWALAVSGPQSGSGAIEPGTNERVWKEFWSSEGGGSDGNPVGTIIMFHGTTPPDGYLPCDGSAFSATTYPILYAQLGKATTPDMRGLFVRGYDNRNTIDPDGSLRNIGTMQGDAIRNITGAFNGFQLTDAYSHGVSTSGAFGIDSPWSYRTVSSGGDGSQNGFTFDASRVVPTSTENRPQNINLLYCIKHD